MKALNPNELHALTLTWLNKLYENLEGRRDWVGVYWVEGYVLNSNSTDLIVGPYIGPATPHVRISQDQGLCGLAVREARTINVADVRAEKRFLACSTTTRSEIVIPIRSGSGEIVGELDIDSNQIGSFVAEDQRWLEGQVKIFGEKLPGKIET